MGNEMSDQRYQTDEEMRESLKLPKEEMKSTEGILVAKHNSSASGIVTLVSSDEEPPLPAAIRSSNRIKLRKQPSASSINGCNNGYIPVAIINRVTDSIYDFCYREHSGNVDNHDRRNSLEMITAMRAMDKEEKSNEKRGAFMKKVLAEFNNGAATKRIKLNNGNSNNDTGGELISELSQVRMIIENSSSTQFAEANRFESSDLVNLEVQHVLQRSNWDCGLACVNMVLRYLGTEVDYNELESAVGTCSVWTIDLLYLLNRYLSVSTGDQQRKMKNGPGKASDRTRNVDLYFCTRTLGVCKDYSSYGFYAADFDTDAVRVEQLFKNAKKERLSLHELPLTIDDIRKLMSTGHFLMILLIDVSTSNRDSESSKVNDLFGCFWLVGMKRQDFQGHYILLYGYDCEEDSFVYHDPSDLAVLAPASKSEASIGSTSPTVLETKKSTGARESRRTISSNELDRVRKCPGTDEDTIIIRV